MKEKDSAPEPKLTGVRGAARRRAPPARRQVKSDRILAEIEHYRERVGDNEEWLRTCKG